MDCLAALSETSEQPYSTCLESLGNVLPGNPNVDESTIADYCASGCDRNLRVIFGKISDACPSDAIVRKIINSHNTNSLLLSRLVLS